MLGIQRIVKASSKSVQSLGSDRINWLRNLPFLGVHAACLLVFWTGVTPIALLVGAVTLLTRMFGLTAGYHRYFCHRTFKTTRMFQFALAWLGAASAQRGPLWWAGHHRLHHRHADTEEDVHPPGVKGFLWAHAGWLMSARNESTRFEWVPDFSQYRELRWLDANHYVAPLSFMLVLFGVGEWLSATYPVFETSGSQLVVIGFVWSTTILYHVTFAVNSFGHLFGRRRYDTNDGSRNSFWLAMLTAGEGWHNNHHRYPGSERQGFYWWEIDATHYGVVVLSWFRLVWDIRGPADTVLREGS